MSEPRPNSPSTGDAWTVRRVLEWTTGHLERHGSESPRLDAEVLLAHARGCKRIELYTRFEEPLTDAERDVMRDLVKRRAEHVPVAHLVGHREFFGLDFQVTADVLVPRPETETLVLEAIDRARERPSPRILDLGTGSGCIAVALATNLPKASVTAVDRSSAALEVARHNADGHGIGDRIDFREGDLVDPVSNDEPFDLIVSNPPYVTESEFETLDPDVRLHEPKLALVAGPDGLDIVRRIATEAARFLKPGGWLLLEVDPQQVPTVESLLTEHVGDATHTRDLNGDPRVVIAQTPTPSS